MAQQHVHVVLAEVLEEGQRLRVVLPPVSGGGFGQRAARSGGRAFQHVAVIEGVGLAEDDGAGDVGLQEVGDGEIGDERAVQLVTAGAALVVAVGCQGVSGSQEGAGAYAGIVIGVDTVVIHVVAVLALLDAHVPFRVHHAHESGIDGSHHAGEIHDVLCARAVVQVGVALLPGVVVVHVGAHLQPFRQLLLCSQTGGDTLIARIVYHAILIEVAQAGVEVAFLGTAIHAHVILLPQGVLVGQVCPVVWRQVVGSAVVIVGPAQCGVGVQLSVHADEVLPFGHGIYVIYQLV